MTMLSSSVIDQLKAELPNTTILTPESEGYEASLKRWSEIAEKRAVSVDTFGHVSHQSDFLMSKGAVAQVTTPDEVAIAIKFARKHKIEQVIRGGGHGTDGASSTEGGIVIDLSKMTRVTVDPRNMTISAEGGCLWKDVDEAAGDYGLAAVGGTVNHVGIGGLTLGGGYGYLTGRYGLVIDNLLKVKVVTANSEIVSASPGERADLFWAIRGAGASFGAVVEFTYRAHKQREPVWAGHAAFSLDKLPEVVEFANNFALAANPDASFNFGFTTPPYATGPMLVTLGFFNGLGIEGKKIFGPLLAAGPLFQDFGSIPYCKVNTLLNKPAAHGGRKVIAGAACALPFALEFYEGIKNEVLAFVKEVPAAKQSLVHFELVPHDKLREVDGSATAFANRGSCYNALCITKWEDPGDDEKCWNYTSMLKEEISRHLTQSTELNTDSVGKYLNYNSKCSRGKILLLPWFRAYSTNPTDIKSTDTLTDATDARTEHLYGFHGEKLVALKLKYDPANVFNKWGDITTTAVDPKHS